MRLRGPEGIIALQSWASPQQVDPAPAHLSLLPSASLEVPPLSDYAIAGGFTFGFLLCRFFSVLCICIFLRD